MFYCLREIGSFFIFKRAVALNEHHEGLGHGWNNVRLVSVNLTTWVNSEV